jgi:hypothetical protein
MPMQMEATDLIARARAGDQDAFRDLVQDHSHELQGALRTSPTAMYRTFAQRLVASRAGDIGGPNGK